MINTKETSKNKKKFKDGDIYLNTFCGDLWVVENPNYIKINDGTKIPLDDPEGFIYVGHIEGVENTYSKEEFENGSK